MFPTRSSPLLSPVAGLTIMWMIQSAAGLLIYMTFLLFPCASNPKHETQVPSPPKERAGEAAAKVRYAKETASSYACLLLLVRMASLTTKSSTTSEALYLRSGGKGHRHTVGVGVAVTPYQNRWLAFQGGLVGLLGLGDLSFSAAKI